MPEGFVYIIVVLYSISILVVLFHSLFDAHLIFHYLQIGGTKNVHLFDFTFIPFVTIQLPVYNERYVVERLLDAVVAIDYPPEKFEIQVLDDSTDETTQIIINKINYLRQQNITIHHIRRQSREGFKAGALKNGLIIAKGEFLAVFDADFLPSKDFLKRTIPYFTETAIGMVQTKWGHINKDSSLLSRLQAIALDGHFSIEQQARNKAGYFINFNGTGGIWRRNTIVDAGNWQADTLTEDFDLSYRAQMKGWKFKYLEDLITPAELPPIVSALKSQQFRWTKGGAETARKHLKALFTSSLPMSTKLHGIYHLVYSCGFIGIIIYALLTIPLLFVSHYYPQFEGILALSRVVWLSLLIYVIHYFISYYTNAKGTPGERVLGFVIHFPLFISLFIGLSLSNAIGIIQGYVGIKSSFVRTPKFNTLSSIDMISKTKYSETRINWLTLTEGALIFYFLYGLFQAFYFKNYGSIPLLVMALTGFSMVFLLSIRESKKTLVS